MLFNLTKHKNGKIEVLFTDCFATIREQMIKINSAERKDIESGKVEYTVDRVDEVANVERNG